MLMNFPKSKRTGTLGEMDVERLFISWSWNVGTDRIDVGYDLYVAPDFEKFSGARFLIQVKGTAKSNKNGRITAQVSKTRLREYAVNVHPVFIVRTTGDGRLFWIHAQEWAAKNRGALSGDGKSQIGFPLENDLRNRNAFERYLEQVLPSIHNDFLDKSIEEFEILNSFNSEGELAISRRSGNGGSASLKTSVQEKTTIRFTASGDFENIDLANEAIGFGLPRSFDVEGLNIKTGGLPILPADEQFPNAKISIVHKPRGYASIVFFPGRNFSINSPGFVIKARVYKGAWGMALSTEGMDSLFDLKMLLPMPHLNKRSTFTWGVRSAALAGSPIQDINELGPLVNWIEQVGAERALFLEVSFKGGKGRLDTESDSFDLYGELLHWLHLIGRLHLVSKALNSNFVLPSAPVFSSQDVSDIGLAYALLKGDVKAVNLKSIIFTPAEDCELAGDDHNAVVKTVLKFSILGQELGDIPVDIQLNNFSIKRIEGAGHLELVKSQNGVAMISHSR